MKLLTLAVAAVLALGAFAASPPASAHGYRGHPRASVGIYFGGPVYRPYWRPYWGPRYYYPPPVYYYPPPVYYSAPAVVVPSSPPVYVERQDAPAAEPAAPAQRPQQWWYWCTEANGYYPYVKECPGGWQRVEPQTPPAS